MRVAIWGLLVASSVLPLQTGCRRASPEISAAPEKERPREAPPPPTPPGKPVTTLVGHAGDVVEVEGQLVKGKPKVLTSVTGKEHVILDLDGSHLPIVSYVTERPTCAGRVWMTGKVIVAAGMARSGSTEGFYAEPQLDVDKWLCR
jgi:hypothetical protein